MCVLSIEDDRKKETKRKEMIITVSEREKKLNWIEICLSLKLNQCIFITLNERYIDSRNRMDEAEGGMSRERVEVDRECTYNDLSVLIKIYSFKWKNSQSLQYFVD